MNPTIPVLICYPTACDWLVTSGSGYRTFEHVAVGDQARHMETALALGYAVDEQVAWPSGYVKGVVAHHDQWGWSEPFARYATLLINDTGLRPVVDEHLRHWRRMLGAVPDGSAVLIVSSGGSIEPVLVAALPDADHASWGGAFHQLEGASLSWNGACFDSLHMIRRGAGPASE